MEEKKKGYKNIKTSIYYFHTTFGKNVKTQNKMSKQEFS